MSFFYFIIFILSSYIALVYLNNLNLKTFNKSFYIIPRYVNYIVIKNTEFIITFYKRNDLIWVDGFLLDFLQKKSADI